MKVGVVLDQKLHSGGGFQQSLNAIRQLMRICPPGIEVEIFTTVLENTRHPALVGAAVQFVPRRIGERLRGALLANVLPIIDSLLTRMKFATNLERKMLARRVDLAYFVGPSAYALAFRSLPYVLTVWDLCHRDHPEFPEVSNGGEFIRREDFYRYAINRSYLTLTDSEELSCRIARRYGADQERLLAMPFQPAVFTGVNGCAHTQDLAARLKLPADYIFYPAQFWPHKNHVRILQALAILQERGKLYSAVFCGGDQCNKNYVRSMAEKYGLADQVLFTGFVDESDMRELYSLSKALVMPTYFGPTNLPPLEAWSVGKPVIYSAPLRDQVENAALCVNPDSAIELAEAIDRIYSEDGVVAELVLAGNARLKELEDLRLQAEKILIEKLEVFSSRRNCWGTM